MMTFLSHMDFLSFSRFFADIHLPPQDVFY